MGSRELFETPRAPDRLLPWPRVRELYGISRTTAWRLQKVGEFPRPVHISSGRVAWRESDLTAWASSRGVREETDGRRSAGSLTSSPGASSIDRTPLLHARSPDAPKTTQSDARPSARHRRPAGAPVIQGSFEF